jgi:c-di-GMP-binding flagellar brake protein YcgR
MPENKRKYPRVDKIFEIDLKVFDDAPSQKKSQNIGLGGVSFLSNDSIPIGKEINLKIKRNIDNRKEYGDFNLLGKVVRCTQQEQVFFIAVEFLQVPKKTKELLDYFLYK